MTELTSYRLELEQGASALGCELSATQCEQLLHYHQLLHKWNRAYNLTAIRDPAAMVSRHLLDSLSIAPFLKGERFIDVGTGAGLPGVVLAIFFPERHFSLLDSTGKKMRFLVQVKSELQLNNIEIYNQRVEQFSPELPYDGVISRAFSALPDMVQLCTALLKPDGLFYAMKGQQPEQELTELEDLSSTGKSYKVEACHRLQVPGEEGERRLFLISHCDQSSGTAGV